MIVRVWKHSWTVNGYWFFSQQINREKSRKNSWSSTVNGVELMEKQFHWWLTKILSIYFYVKVKAWCSKTRVLLGLAECQAPGTQGSTVYQVPGVVGLVLARPDHGWAWKHAKPRVFWVWQCAKPRVRWVCSSRVTAMIELGSALINFGSGSG
jgi:hypothetical protein